MALSAQESPDSTTDSPRHDNDNQLDSLRDLLLAKEKEQIQSLEQRNLNAEQQIAALLEQLQSLQQTLTAVQADAVAQRSRADALQTQIDELQSAVQAESEAMIPRLIQQMSHIIKETIHNSRDEMAAALGPIMGEAIRVQIRDSRKSMIEALFPIILETVQRAIAAFARELQQNIDARLKTTFKIRDIGRTIRARLSGVSPSALAFRDALPFAIQELFLIHHETGMVMAHSTNQPDEATDSDVISGMLTAIRDFVRDSFGDGSDTEELDAVDYGDERIIISSGEFAYLALVLNGVEPEGFRTRLREFLANLHLTYSPQFRDYAGDSAALPVGLPDKLAQFCVEMQGTETAVSQPLSRSEKNVLMWGGLAGIVFIALACFYLQFTLALWPVAFGAPTATATQTATQTATMVPATHTPTTRPTNTPTHTPPPTATYTPTSIPTNMPTHTPLPPTATPSPIPTVRSHTNASVWVRPFPDVDTPTELLVLADTAVSVQAQYGEWVEIVWETADGPQQGWVPVQWVTLSEEIPTEKVTPVTVVPLITTTPEPGG